MIEERVDALLEKALGVWFWIAGIAVFMILFIGAGALDDLDAKRETVVTGWEKIEMDDQKNMSTEQVRKKNAVARVSTL